MLTKFHISAIIVFVVSLVLFFSSNKDLSVFGVCGLIIGGLFLTAGLFTDEKVKK